MEVSAFMAERLDGQLEKMAAKLETQRQEYEAKIAAQRQEYEAKIAAQRQEYEAKIEAQRQEYEAKNCASNVQLERLQDRFNTLHQAKLLSDDEMFALQDKVVDFIECRMSVTVVSENVGALAETVKKLVGVCEGVSNDTMLARQLRRKFLQVHETAHRGDSSQNQHPK